MVLGKVVFVILLQDRLGKIFMKKRKRFEKKGLRPSQQNIRLGRRKSFSYMSLALNGKTFSKTGATKAEKI